MSVEFKYSLHIMYNAQCTPNIIHTAHNVQYTRYTCTIHISHLVQLNLAGKLTKYPECDLLYQTLMIHFFFKKTFLPILKWNMP